ncbi:MAG: molecular chaperone DnaJ [Halobacteriaceae archaeon]
MAEDFYDVLGVSQDADEEEIKQAYRKKAAKYHPDVSDEPDAEETFKKIKKAKEVLTDEEQRQLYDRLGHERFKEAEKRGATDQGGGAGAGTGAGGPFGGGGGDPFGGAAGGGFEDIFEQFFGGGGGGRGQQGGRDLKTSVTISLEEAYEGAEKQVSVRRPEQCETCGGSGHPADASARTCPQCDGRGQTTRTQQTPFGRVQQTGTCRRCEGQGEIYSETCGTCGGDGVVERESTLTVEIPAGVQTGQSVALRGEGAPGERGARKGDLIIEINVQVPDEIERDGADLRLRQPISFPQAVFGDTIEIETVTGTVEMDVPEGTQSGETFRLSGKGMPRLERRGYGDLYVTVQVVVPESLEPEQREALEAYAEAGGEEIEIEQGLFERLRNSI